MAEAAGNLISKAAAANMPEVQTAVNALVQDMTAYASELLATPVTATTSPSLPQEA
ncbi:hypothetical protein D3C84_1303630 [compost metagenome]